MSSFYGFNLIKKYGKLGRGEEEEEEEEDGVRVRANIR